MNKKTGVKIKFSFIKILSASDLSKRRLPLMMIKSSTPGPVVWLTGCMHGDEIGGTVVIHQLFKRLKNELIRGTVYSFPLMNPMGFENVTRNISISREDLNRSFPGNSQGTFAQRIACIIFDEIISTGPDLVLDLHNDWNKSIPYVLVDAMVTEKNILEKSLVIARQSGLVIIQDTDRIDTTLTINLLRKNIPALTIELGESLIINEKNVEYGVKAVWNLLCHLCMVANGPLYQFPAIRGIKDQILTYYSLPLSNASGIIQFVQKPGEIIRKGQKIARICNAFGKITQTLKAQQDGIILGHTDYAVTYPGAPVMAFGLFSRLKKEPGFGNLNH